MGYRDSQLILSDEQAVTSTAISTNVYDLQSEDQTNALQNIGVGEDMYLVVETVDAATDSGSDATLTVTLESAENAALSTNAAVHATTGAMAFAAFSPAGTKLMRLRLPENIDYKRYLGVRFTVGSGPLTAGKFNAYLAKDIENTKAYKSGFTV